MSIIILMFLWYTIATVILFTNNCNICSSALKQCMCIGYIATEARDRRKERDVDRVNQEQGERGMETI